MRVTPEADSVSLRPVRSTVDTGTGWVQPAYRLSTALNHLINAFRRQAEAKHAVARGAGVGGRRTGIAHLVPMPGCMQPVLCRCRVSGCGSDRGVRKFLNFFSFDFKQKTVLQK